MKQKCLTESNVNQKLLNIQYAVRGPIVARAAQIEREIQKGAEKPFSRVIRANIGDCHALGQKPFTFVRQVLAVAACPALMSCPDIPDDVKERVKEILDDCTQGSVGAYSPPAGLTIVRRHVAQYLTARDGVPASPEDIYLGAGASDLIKAVLTLFVQDVGGRAPGVMIPIPQYPLFSGTLSELGLTQVPYYLDEESGWALPPSELQRAWSHADCSVRALVVINPGNPTGQVLSRDNIEEIVRFAYERNLFILADEVYQENIVSKEFHSFKKAMHEMGAPYSAMELASFVTSSKGWAAECGARAAFVELCRVAPRVLVAFNAARAVAQCPSVLGQCVIDCVVKPPAPGSPSYTTWSRERRDVRRVLQQRAAAATRAFNSLPGYFCNVIEGSMFAFPRVDLPAGAVRAAAERGLAPDEFYCLQLLEETGVCVVPGSGFGQRAGSFHFRTTILHPASEFAHMLAAITNFHHQFLKTYSLSCLTDDDD
ncbi:alanine aminotransferase 1-like [Aricia agestis]|uniref:alanine aminotransferase 1-like n=1 Tax=Aricia agestis TaxID=91739 RepID=UPI001C20ACFB|nr:alanine aminotransferase 1-like [Aricia agestis]